MEFSCAICLSNFTIERAALLRCGHGFHADCIRQSVQASGKCPVCRTGAKLSTIISRLYLTAGDRMSEDRAMEASVAVPSPAHQQLRVFRAQELTRRLNETQEELLSVEEERNTLTTRLQSSKYKIRSLKSEMKKMKVELSDKNETEKRNAELFYLIIQMQKKLEKFEKILKVQDDRNDAWLNSSSGSGELETLHAALYVLKRKFKAMQIRHSNVIKQLTAANEKVRKYEQMNLALSENSASSSLPEANSSEVFAGSVPCAGMRSGRKRPQNSPAHSSPIRQPKKRGIVADALIETADPVGEQPSTSSIQYQGFDTKMSGTRRNALKNTFRSRK